MKLLFVLFFATFCVLSLNAQGPNVISAPSRAADCPPGYTNNGANCGRGAHDIRTASRAADCPKGYTNMGMTCYRGPSTYTKGCTTVFKKYPCKKGYTDNGCFCGRGAKSLGMGSMKCKSGEFKSGGRCYKNCPPGYTNTGEFCHRPASTLGMGSMSCPRGYFKKGARCYKICPTGYNNMGETCNRSGATLAKGSTINPVNTDNSRDRVKKKNYPQNTVNNNRGNNMANQSRSNNTNVIDMFVGTYENHLYDSRGKNGYHYVRVTKIDNSRLKWTNRAGVSWTLTYTSDKTKLFVGTDCGYYADGYRIATVKWKNGRVKAILGPGNEPYDRN